MEATLAVVLCLLAVVAAQDQNVSSLNCTYTGAPDGCTAYFYHTQSGAATDVANLYGVPTANVTAVPGATAFAVGMQCSCSDLPSGYNQSKVYAAVTKYTVSSQDANYSSIVAKFDNAVLVPDKPVIEAGTVYLCCGCLPPQYAPYTAVVTYKIQVGDMLFAISSSFESNMSAIQSLNQISNADLIYADQILFLPVKSIDTITRKASEPPLPVQETGQVNKKHQSAIRIAVGVAAAMIGVSLLLVGAALSVTLKKFRLLRCYEHRRLNDATGNSTMSATQDLREAASSEGWQVL